MGTGSASLRRRRTSTSALCEGPGTGGRQGAAAFLVTSVCRCSFPFSFSLFGGSTLVTLGMVGCVPCVCQGPPLPSPPGGRHGGPSCPPCKALPLSPPLVSTSPPRVCHTNLSPPSGSGRSAPSPVRAGGFVGRLCRPLRLPLPFCNSLLMIVKFLLFLQEGKR